MAMIAPTMTASENVLGTDRHALVSKIVYTPDVRALAAVPWLPDAGF
jgi:hypothetical protein